MMKNTSKATDSDGVAPKPTPAPATYEPPLRILSMDGGGIYGLFTVLMLKDLCKKDKNFLKGDDVHLFAGTSAGALIALALAGAENPRDIIMSGLLEKFFNDSRLYGKGQRPGNAITGLLGITSWACARGVEELFKEYYGNTRMGDLKHKVLISAFDLHGNPEHGDQQKWESVTYYNFPRTEDNRRLEVWRVAYGAAAPVMWRPIINGISDGGIFANSPTIHTIAKILEYRRNWDEANDRENPGEGEEFSLDRSLKNLRLLSLGVGSKIPHYGARDFNLGYLAFSLMPTNMKTKDYWPPMVYLALDPQVQKSNFISKQFLGERFHRLDPGVLGYPIPPVLASMYLSRFDPMRKFIVKHIRRGMDTKVTKDELINTSKWLSSVWRVAADPEPKFREGPLRSHQSDVDEYHQNADRQS